MSRVRRAAFVAGPLLAGLVGVGLHVGTELAAPACWTAAITVLCATWWIFEPIPLAATSGCARMSCGFCHTSGFAQKSLLSQRSDQYKSASMGSSTKSAGRPAGRWAGSPA